MKRLHLVIIAVILLFNLMIAQPSWAGKSKQPLTENPDYIEITQTLDNLQLTKDTPPEGTTTEEIQKQINDLEFQKYALETGVSWGQCRNETGKTLAVYGQKSKKSVSTYDNDLYFLADGQTTDEKWDCDGIYVPNDVTIAGVTTSGNAGAIKIVNGSRLVAKINPETNEIELNVPITKVLASGEVNWFIPNIPQASLDLQIANAPTIEND